MRQLAFIASARECGSRVATDWLFACSCGGMFTHQRRAGAKTAFSVHAHTENRRA